MTTHDHVAAAPTDAAPENPLAADPAEPSNASGAGVICEAEVVDIGLAGTGTDPFDATFLLAGTDPKDREIVVWIRLTPTTINDLIDRLGEVLFAQQDILGLNRHLGATDDVGPARDNTDEDDPDPGNGRVKRFFDPMGIRHLKDRSPRTTVFIGAAIASLVILAFILHLVRG